MNKYVPADRVLSEIERLEQENCMSGGEHFCMRRAICLGNLRNIVTPLYHKQTEVDWGKEYKSYMEQRRDDLSGVAVTINMKDLARHFYELGLNAKKDR